MLENSENNVPFTKENLENPDLNQLRISLQYVNELWLNTNTQKLLIDKLLEIRNDVYSKKLLIGNQFLKLIVVTADIEGVSQYWGKQLNRNEGITKQSDSVVAGKLIFWHKNDNFEIEECCAVMLINETVAIDLIDNNQERQNEGKHVIVHELAHIETELINLIRREKLNTNNNDTWALNKYALAEVLWEEFYATYKAYKYAPSQNIQASNSYFSTLLAETTESVDQEILDYRTYNDVTRLYNFVIRKLEMLIAQLGRCLGSIKESGTDDKNKILVENFFAGIRDVSIRWEEITRQIYEILDGEIFITDQGFDELSSFVANYLIEFGLVLERQSDQSIYIDVPFTEKTTPKSTDNL
ncbi:MAG: hypothetical protein RLP44_25010 [Aggregatilineales bacterium]